MCVVEAAGVPGGGLSLTAPMIIVGGLGLIGSGVGARHLGGRGCKAL